YLRLSRNAHQISCALRMLSPLSIRREAKKSACSRQCCRRYRGDPMFYFAYGSNMDWDQMKGRCPSARIVGVAELRDYRLAFTRRSLKRGCGVCDVVLDSGKAVWGAVFHIDDADVVWLDIEEGY